MTPLLPGPAALPGEHATPGAPARWSTGSAGRVRPGLLEWAFILLPVLSVLGGAGFLWPLLAPLCIVGLLDARDGRLPGGSPALVALLAWAALTSLPLVGEGLGPLLLGAYRWMVLAALLGLFLHIANRLDRPAAIRTTTIIMVSVWSCLVGFGLLSYLAPAFEVPTLVQAVLPRAFLSNSYLSDLTRFRLSEIQLVLGEISYRPAAPFAYANGWGSAFTLTTPITGVWLLHGRSGLRRALGAVVLALGAVVAIASLNRAVWLLLAVMALYAGARNGQRLRTLLVAVPLATVVLVGALTFTPLGDRVQQRLAVAAESDRTRTSVVTEAVDASIDAPLAGYGAPIERQNGVPVGTHGFSWYLMISHGLVGFALFAGWLLWVTVTGVRAAGPMGRAAHLTLVLTLLQFPVYGLLPQLPLVGEAAALCLHLDHRADSDNGSSR